MCGRFTGRTGNFGGGHIYQGRYKSFPIQDERYLDQVMRYVEANPLRAGLVAAAEDWPWSSLSSASAVPPGLTVIVRPHLMPWPRDARWRQRVNEPLPAAPLAAVRQSAQRGSPHGDPVWTESYATLHHMQTSVRPRGRPRKVFEEN